MTVRYAVLAAVLLAVAGCAPPPGDPAPPTLEQDSPTAAFHAAQQLLADGRYGRYHDALLSAASKRALAEKRAALAERIAGRSAESEFDIELAELGVGGMDVEALRRMSDRPFAVAWLSIRYRRPADVRGEPAMVIVDAQCRGDRGWVRYRVGPESPLHGRMHFVREGGLWRVEDVEALAAGAPPAQEEGAVDP